ncbi:MAG TPA: hypothetical protein VE821_12845, partial [Pyrinomonadaceae bacterium]|nr:hypothetical protein [Pyrinomonadaceae bacterium]
MPIDAPKSQRPRLRVWHLWPCLALLSALVAPVLLAHAQTQQQAEQTQTPQPEQTPAQRPRRVTPTDVLPEDNTEVYRVDTDLVLVDASVTDATGRPVRNL